MDLDFGEQSYKQEFQLVSSSFPLPYDGILGMDFLTGTDTVLDYERQRIAVFGNLMNPMNLIQWRLKELFHDQKRILGDCESDRIILNSYVSV